MKYFIYNRDRDGEDAYYWTGILRPSGRPAITDGVEKAIRFNTAREAYEEAGKYPSLRLWRVGARAG